MLSPHKVGCYLVDARRQTPDARRQTPDARRQTQPCRHADASTPQRGGIQTGNGQACGLSSAKFEQINDRKLTDSAAWCLRQVVALSNRATSSRLKTIGRLGGWLKRIERQNPSAIWLFRTLPAKRPLCDRHPFVAAHSPAKRPLFGNPLFRTFATFRMGWGFRKRPGKTKHRKRAGSTQRQSLRKAHQTCPGRGVWPLTSRD